MIMGRVGKVRTFKISPRVVMWAAVFLALYLPATALVVNQWADLRRERLERQERISELELELAQAERSLFKFQQHVSLLEAYIEGLEIEQESRLEEAASGPAEEPPEEEPEKEQAEPEPVQQGLVDVERMSIAEEGDAVTVDFNLVNIDRGEDPVSGYVHIIARGSGRDGRTWTEVHPRGETGENGLPDAYRVGHPFIIQRFKPIEGEFNVVPDRGKPDTIRVVVYDESGRRIFDNSYEVGNAS